MHPDNLKDFDLQIRSMVENAEEKVPSRVWRAVREDLDRREAAIVSWKWIVPALACSAAVILIGLFLFHKPDNDNVIEVNPVASLEAEPESSGVQDSAIPTEKTIIVGATYRSPLTAMAQTALPEKEEEVCAVTDEIRPAETAEAAGQSVSCSEESPLLETWDEEPAEKEQITLFAGGALGGNDSELFPAKFGAKHAPLSSSVAKAGISETGASTYSIPLSFGVGADIPFSGKVGMRAGLSYSFLSRTFAGSLTRSEGGEIKTYVSDDITQNLHYIGLPVNVYYNIIGSDKVKFYCFGGGTLEYCLSNNYTLRCNSTTVYHKENVRGLMFSASAGLGVEFSVTDFLGLYIDPSAHYYFRGNQPKSLRTDKPFMLNFELGVRFNL